MFCGRTPSETVGRPDGDPSDVFAMFTDEEGVLSALP